MTADEIAKVAGGEAELIGEIFYDCVVAFEAHGIPSAHYDGADGNRRR